MKFQWRKGLGTFVYTNGGGASVVSRGISLRVTTPTNHVLLDNSDLTSEGRPKVKT